MISESYKEQNRLLHETDETYGISGYRYVDPIRELSDYGRLTVLDYGCGKETLKRALGPAYKTTGYDPCIAGLDTKPEPHDVVACTDVMEHVEPEFIDDVLKDVRRLTKRKVLFSISVVPAQKVLADGRNAHISLLSIDEWIAKVENAGFKIESKHDADGKYNTFGLVCV
jgi:hypothetical protein